MIHENKNIASYFCYFLSIEFSVNAKSELNKWAKLMLSVVTHLPLFSATLTKVASPPFCLLFQVSGILVM